MQHPTKQDYNDALGLDATRRSLERERQVRIPASAVRAVASIGIIFVGRSDAIGEARVVDKGAKQVFPRGTPKWRRLGYTSYAEYCKRG